MSFSVADIPVMVINLPGMSERRSHMSRMLGAQGITPIFVDGVRGQGKIRGAAAAHAAAFDAAPSTPFLVLEDDVGLMWDDVKLPSIPQATDVVYLGTHTGGCFPNTTENRETFGHRHLTGFALASLHAPQWWRLHSMISAHAVLILTDTARSIWREELRISYRRKTPLDVRYAYLMARHNVMALRRPMFVEKQELQPAEKQSVERWRLTHMPLIDAYPGDLRRAEKRGWDVTAEVARATDGRLHWEVLQKHRIDERDGAVQDDGLRA